jgi:basic amino acid/polyamine antiporter, APA family
MKQPKSLGVWTLTALVAGNMIGSGIFLLPSALAHYGSISLLGWLFTALGAIILALLFAELGQSMPQQGGPYAYCRDAFGEFTGFLVAYNYWLALWIGNAGIAVAFVSYSTEFIPGLNQNPLASTMMAIFTVWLLTAVNLRGVRTAGIVQLIMTIFKIAPLLLIAGVGLFYIKPDNFTVFNVSGLSDWSAFSATATLTLWAFIGVESATVPVDNIADPKRDIPRGTLYGTLLVALVYILSNVVVIGLVPNSLLATSAAPYADAAYLLFGPVGKALLAFGAMCACFGALNGWIMLQAQIPLIAAQDQLFPAAFQQLNRHQSPRFGLIVSSALISILLMLRASANLVDQFTFFINLAVFATLIPYILTSMAKIVLMIKQPQAFSGRNIKVSISLAGLAFCYSFWAIYGAGQETVFYGTLLFFSAVPLFVWMKWRALVRDEALSETVVAMEHHD